jgi:hypothetical protein
MSRVLSLAGFEVTLIGRFWVIPEDRQTQPLWMGQASRNTRDLHRRILRRRTFRQNSGITTILGLLNRVRTIAGNQAGCYLRARLPARGHPMADSKTHRAAGLALPPGNSLAPNVGDGIEGTGESTRD